MPAAVVQFVILGGNQDAARPSIGWVRAKGGETLVFLPPDHPHALIKIIGCFVCTTCPLYNTTLFLHTAYGRNFVVQMVRGTTVLYHHYWWRFLGFAGMMTKYDSPLQQLLNNWHSLFSKLIAKYWNMMDDGCHRSFQHDDPLDKALRANLVCTEKLSFSRDAAGRDWKIHKLWVSSIRMKMELSIFLSQQGNISRCMQMWCEILLDSGPFGFLVPPVRKMDIVQ